MNVLVSLYKGYGLGDAISMSSVLRHIRKYRPDWQVDFQAEKGREVVARGLCTNFFRYGQPYPTPHYDAEVQLIMYETFAGWTDRPNTRAASCLHERFGMAWDAECGRYQVNVSANVADWARTYVGRGYVAIHYEGVTAKDKKDLTPQQAQSIIKEIGRQGRKHYVLGPRSLFGLAHDAEANTAVIAQCEAFVGIDSGPAKCASATETPSLVIWTGHHPAFYHDPAPNTTHLVPRGYHDLAPVCGNKAVVEWFEKHYNVIEYESDPTPQVAAWLRQVLQ